MIKKLFLILGLMLITNVAYATAYWVRTDGSDSNTGTANTAAGAWLTIQHAVDTATTPGDVVTITAGTYFESSITGFTSGTSGNVITFQGEMSGGDHMTIIDGGTTVTGWTLAGTSTGHTWAEGDGIYVTTTLGFEPYCMNIIIDNFPHKIQRLCQPHDSGVYCGNWQAHLSETSTGTYDPSPNVTSPDTVDYWYGIEAHFSTDSGGSNVYFAERNDTDPSTLTIKAVPDGYGIEIYGKDYVTFKDLKLINQDIAINIGKLLGVTPCTNITVDNCRVIGGARSLSTDGPTNCTISNNEFSNESYGQYINSTYTRGPWIDGSGELAGVREHLYQYEKYPVGYGSGDRAGMTLLLTGDTHTVNDNIFRDTPECTIFYCSNLTAYNNTMYNCPSVGLAFSSSVKAVTGDIYDNTIYNINNCFRFNDINDGGHSIEIYRNKTWNPQGAGRAIFYHHDITGGTITNWATLKWYHNSFAGGAEWSSYSSYYNTWTSGGDRTSRDFYFINNIISATELYNEAGSETGFQTEVFDHNWVYHDGVQPTHAGIPAGGNDDNVWNAVGLYWNSSSLTDWLVTSDETILDVGIDVSQSHTPDSTAYGAVGDFGANYWNGSGPDIGAIQQNPPVAPLPNTMNPSGGSFKTNL